MLETQIAVQIVISLCVGLSYLAIKHYETFKKSKDFVNIYTFLATSLYLTVSYFCFDFSQGAYSFLNYLFEIFLVLFTKFYYSIANYIGYSINNEGKN